MPGEEVRARGRGSDVTVVEPWQVSSPRRRLRGEGGSRGRSDAGGERGVEQVEQGGVFVGKRNEQEAETSAFEKSGAAF